VKRLAPIVLVLALAGCGGSTKTVTVTTPSAGATTTGPATTGSSSGGAGITTTSTSSSGGAAVNTTSTSSSPATPTRTVALSTFRSPSGNIGCLIIGGSARCDIRNRHWSPPPHPSSCPPVVNYGQGLIVDTTGNARFVCAGDTALNQSAPPLPYGVNTQVGGLTCASRSTGMTCTNASGHGFTIAIQGYRIF
jgi:hypothetical protein